MDCPRTVRQLQKHGYSIVPDAINQDFCKKIIDFLQSSLQSESSEQGIRYIKADGYAALIGDGLSVEDGNVRQNRNIEELLKPLLRSPDLHNISEQYFGRDSLFAARTQFIESRRPLSPSRNIPFCPHYDRLRYLKFYFFLVDINSKDGALEVGSLPWVSEVELRRDAQKASGKRWEEISGDVLDGYLGNMMPIEGSAGTLVILDGSQPHQHGLVKSDKVRKVLQIESVPWAEVGFGYNRNLARVEEGSLRIYDRLRRLFWRW
jgi:hypothetical protein